MSSKNDNLSVRHEPGDDVLLTHGVMCIAGADGAFDAAEIKLVEAVFAELPDFRDKDVDELIEGAREVVGRYDSLADSLEALAGLSSDAQKRKMYVIAVDIALASGGLDPRERTMLGTMRKVLGIDEDLDRKVLDVLSMKYTRP